MNNGEVGRVALDSNNYEAKINHIAISHQRTRAPYGPLAEGKQTISRSELGKLMRIARIARPEAIYDASAAAQTFSAGELIEGLERCGGFRNGEKEVSGNERGMMPNACLDLPNLRGGFKMMLTRQTFLSK